MSLIQTILPSKIANAQIKQANSEQYLVYTVLSKNEKAAEQSFEWDLKAQEVATNALARLKAVNYIEKTIMLEYQRKMIMSEAIKTYKLDPLKILFQLIEACYELHKQSLLGRCFSLSAIEADQNSQIKIYRYGFVHDLQRDKEMITLPPEFLFENKLSIHSDIWLIGMIFYQLVFGKPLVNYAYPDQLSLYKQYLQKQMINNTFENLFDNSIDHNYSIFLQLLLIFDAETRLQSYPAVLYQLQALLPPDYSKKLIQMANFYDSETEKFQTALSLIETRAKQRDCQQLQKKNFRSISSVKSQKLLSYEDKSFQALNMKKNGIVRRSYGFEQEMNVLEFYYQIKLKGNQQFNPQDSEFCQFINFNMYQISFLLQFRKYLKTLNIVLKNAVHIDHYLYSLTYKLIQQKIEIVSNQAKFQITFQIELSKIKNQLELLLNRMKDLNIMCEKIEGNLMYNIENCSNEILDYQEKVLRKKEFFELKLRFYLALNIQKVFNDSKTVNKQLHPIIYFLGGSEITEPLQVERFLLRGTAKYLEHLYNFVTGKQNNVVISICSSIKGWSRQQDHIF